MFTKRQHELVILASNGLSYKEIAREVGITEATVKMHMGRLLLKMRAKGFGLGNITGVVALALRKGWIQ